MGGGEQRVVGAGTVTMEGHEGTFWGPGALGPFPGTIKPCCVLHFLFQPPKPSLSCKGQIQTVPN